MPSLCSKIVVICSDHVHPIGHYLLQNMVLMRIAESSHLCTYIAQNSNFFSIFYVSKNLLLLWWQMGLLNLEFISYCLFQIKTVIYLNQSRFEWRPIKNSEI